MVLPLGTTLTCRVSFECTGPRNCSSEENLDCRQMIKEITNG